MTTNAKAFDCVAMKDDVQGRLLAEFEGRRQEFPTFVDFLRAKADESPWVRKMRRRSRTQAAASPVA